jgi:hypothetical protein
MDRLGDIVFRKGLALSSLLLHALFLGKNREPGGCSNFTMRDWMT